MSLSGNMPIKEMLDRKIKWIKNDDSKALSYEMSLDSIKLEP